MEEHGLRFECEYGHILVKRRVIGAAKHCDYCNAILIDATQSYECDYCELCDVSLCDGCTSLTDVYKYNYRIACNLYKNITNEESTEFERIQKIIDFTVRYDQDKEGDGLKMMRSLTLLSKNISDSQNSNSIESGNDENKINRRATVHELVDFDIIFNQWYEHETLKTLLMIAVGRNEYKIVEILVHHKVKCFNCSTIVVFFCVCVLGCVVVCFLFDVFVFLFFVFFCRDWSVHSIFNQN